MALKLCKFLLRININVNGKLLLVTKFNFIVAVEIICKYFIYLITR